MNIHHTVADSLQQTMHDLIPGPLSRYYQPLVVELDLADVTFSEESKTTVSAGTNF